MFQKWDILVEMLSPIQNVGYNPLIKFLFWDIIEITIYSISIILENTIIRKYLSTPAHVPNLIELYNY